MDLDQRRLLAKQDRDRYENKARPSKNTNLPVEPRYGRSIPQNKTLVSLAIPIAGSVTHPMVHSPLSYRPRLPDRGGVRNNDSRQQTPHRSITPLPEQQCDNAKNGQFIQELIGLISNRNLMSQKDRVQKLREKLHEAPFRRNLTKNDIHSGGILAADHGLPVIINASPNDIPYDVRADAQELHYRWLRHDFSADLYRGLETTDPNGLRRTGRNRDRLDETWLWRAHAKDVRNSKFVNGQWWPTLLCAVRDGAHGCSQGGTYGVVGQGVVSILLGDPEDYEDKDMGDTIFYCSTRGCGEGRTESTKRFRESVGYGQSARPVRVLRSFNLPRDNELRPISGYRYDGLYTVVPHEISENDYSKFELRRKPGQDPIRSSGVEARPTKEEHDEYVADKVRNREAKKAFEDAQRKK